MKVAVPCVHCNGTGKFISPVFSETGTLFDDSKVALTTAQVSKALNISSELAYSRLSKLVEFGYLTKYHENKRWHYTKKQ